MPARYFNAAPRAYSPSRPVALSSDNEQDEDDELARKNPVIDEDATAISGHTFFPQRDVSAFQVTSDDVGALALQNTSKGVVLSMASGSFFAFVGVCCATILRGTVSLMGVRLLASPRQHPVFSPRSNPLAVIKAVDCAPVINSTTLPSQILNKADNSGILVLLQPFRTGIESLGRYRILSHLFHLDDNESNKLIDDIINIEGLYFVDPSSPPKPQMQPYLLNDSWSNALYASIPTTVPLDDFSLPKTFIGLVRGPKNCGKSTFARTLLNTLMTRYNRVAFLECDIGQSEFTPGGTVSLHVLSAPIFGPPFTHPTIPFRAHYIGNSTPRSSPSQYIAAIQSLMETYRLEVQYLYEESADDDRLSSIVPLVVNTHGWIKGLGADLIQRIEDLVSPTIIFNMGSEAPLHVEHGSQSAQVHHIQPIISSVLNQYFTAADHRTFAILSYFHVSFWDGGTAVGWNTELPLCAHRPWEVMLKTGIDKIILAGTGAEDVVPNELRYAINCSLVGLICDDHSSPEAHEMDTPFYIQGDELPSPSHTRCVGLALVRGVDLKNGKLHILTPLPRNILWNCRTLVKGELEMPVWGMIDFRDGTNSGVMGVSWGKVPYLQMGHGDVGANVLGAAKRRVRRNLMRKNQALF